MAPEFDQKVRELFDRAQDRPKPERLDFLRRECLGDEFLYAAVERLLTAQDSANSFMNSAARPAQRIGRFLVQGELGRGGMGIVYDAVDPVIGRGVAVKVINLKNLSSSEEYGFLRERLFREARSCGQLLHPGIVIVFDVGQEQESAFIAMERVDGPSLSQMLSVEKRLPAGDTLRILQEAASALDYAHKNGIVHRDVKPANIMIGSDGRVKIADFGIAKIMSGAATTMTGVVMGTPSYMSPEQLEAREVSGRSDQFSLAVVAYEMLTGAKPFKADSVAGVAHMIVYGERPSPHLVNAELPAALAPVFHRAFSREPRGRFESCEAFVNELRAAFQPAKAITPRAKVGYSAAAALLLALAAGSFYFYSKPPVSSTVVTANSAPVAAPNAPPEDLKRSAPPLDNTFKDARLTPSTPPVIKEFSADPDAIKTGTPATLLWEVSGAERVVIEPGIGKVAPKGMTAVVPHISTTYQLIATGAAGASKRTLSIVVTPDPEAVPASVRARQFYTDAQKMRHDGQAEQAAELYTKAAQLGDTDAMVQLGELYSSGEGVGEDQTQALRWFNRAAEAGNVSGMLALGGMDLLGVNGGEPNEEEAARWFQKAAERESPAAMFNLAGLYESGHGVAKNLDKAKGLYQRAAKLGNQQAAKRLAQLGVAIEK